MDGCNACRRGTGLSAKRPQPPCSGPISLQTAVIGGDLQRHRVSINLQPQRRYTLRHFSHALPFSEKVRHRGARKHSGKFFWGPLVGADQRQPRVIEKLHRLVDPPAVILQSRRFRPVLCAEHRDVCGALRGASSAFWDIFKSPWGELLHCLNAHILAHAKVLFIRLYAPCVA